MTAESSPDPDLPKAHNARGYLNHHELGLLLRLHAEDTPQAVIAQRLGISQPGVCKALKRLGVDSTELAKHHFKAQSFDVARRVTRVAKTGKDGDAVKAAKVVLEGAGVITQGVTAVVGVQVMIGTSGTPALAADSVEVEVLDSSTE